MDAVKFIEERNRMCKSFDKYSCRCIGMAAKVNPRRVPRTEADVAAAYTKGVTEGLNRGIELMLYVLIDKHDAPMEDVQQLAVELNHAAECVAEGYVTWAGVRRMLKEYNVEVELV